MQKLVTTLLLVCTVLASGCCAPTLKQELAAIEEVLGEIENSHQAEKQQNKFTNYLNQQFSKYMKTLAFRQGIDEHPEIQQTTWKGLLRSMLNSATKYAMHKLRPKELEQLVKISGRDEYPQIAGFDEHPQIAGFDEHPQIAGFDEHPQIAGFDEHPQIAGFDEHPQIAGFDEHPQIAGFDEHPRIAGFDEHPQIAGFNEHPQIAGFDEHPQIAGFDEHPQIAGYNKLTKVQQNSFRELLSTLLESANNYAQNKLSRPMAENKAEAEFIRPYISLNWGTEAPTPDWFDQWPLKEKASK